ncbi:ATP-binding protein [Amycolatopsis sp. NPDC059657]|uniref:ATP-binding protein n=1 Tax=Amycolatopsis sp. NPDC059657 TaxID=3346899 RepID=UPI00366AB7F4
MTGALIGRDHPAGLLRGEIGRATESHGGLVLVTGEAGIGKTTLVTGAVEEARRLGALVLGGTCWDSGSAPGYWPWVQVIRALKRAATPEEWSAADTGPLAALLGEGGEAVEGFELYDAVTTALVAVSQSRPVVVVLDDLHWADQASLKLLGFAAQHTWFERLLLIGTYRDVEVEAADHPLRELMLPLVAKATTVTLTGLGPEEVAALMERTAGAQPDGELAAEVHARTGGNPFFVEQTARLWHSGGSVSAIAPGVRDALRRRLSLLPEPVVRLLESAAVLGREFHRQVLAATVAEPVPQVDRLLDQAVTARLVTVRGAGLFSFAHDLVRESLYAELAEDRRRQRHAAVVRALDRSPALAERVFPADRARHGFLAGAEVDNTRAVDLLVAAARDATARLATEETAGHFRRALEIVADPARRAKLALDLGGELLRSGERVESWQRFDQALALARELDDADLLARVGLTLTKWAGPGEREQLKLDVLGHAHRMLCGGEEGLTVEQMTLELTARVAMLARNDADDNKLAFSLWARHDAIWAPGNAPEREKLTDELVVIGNRTGDLEMEHFAASLKWVALLEQGDPRFLDQFHVFVGLTERQGVPASEFAAKVDQSIISTLMGRFAEAETLLDQVMKGYGYHHAYFGQMVGHLTWTSLLAQGRFDELAELHPQLRQEGFVAPWLLETITAAQRGDAAETRELYKQAAAGEPYPVDLGQLWLRCQAQAAALSGDLEWCARLRPRFAEFSGAWLVSLYGCDISGPMDLWAGVLDLALGRWDDAVETLTAAHRSADRMRIRTWSVEARAYLAEALRGRGDTEAATVLFDEVTREAESLGMRHIPVRAGQSRTVVPLSANEFRREEAVWTLGFEGVTARLPDAKGLRDLHFLLGSPGSDVPAVRLLNPEGGEVVVAARRLGGDAMLDDEAKAQYKRRLDQLDAEIDSAAARGDDARASTLDAERDALLHELRAAAGLGGRTRRLGDEAERARKTVTARIRDTLRKIGEVHPPLAAHLRESVTTGSTCRYAPDTRIPWRL